ncbi:MAG: TVP38/TMEM64 family protein [Thermodesulfobacteriota bacterium]
MANAQPPKTKKPSIIRPLIFLGILVAGYFVLRYFHLEQYLEKERLRQFIAAFGLWGPIIYLAIWSVAPILFLPGLPITIAGGVLFGPIWGLVYTVLGATVGAVTSFLVARYLARDWVESKLAGTKLLNLDYKVSQEGWKIVFLTRLIPFPFFVVNYSFGLTRVSCLSYTLATFFGIIPLTAVFIYFSANLLDLLQGKISKELVIGALLVVLISLITLAYKKFKAKKGDTLEL